MYELGNCLMNGIGVAKNEKSGVTWLQKSHMKGYKNATKALALYYQEEAKKYI
jgi:TPR repeat protein